MLLKNLEYFQRLEVPILTGVSRKSMINNILNIKSKDALNGTSILHSMALLSGTQILRVHDVKEAKEAINLVDYYRATI
jgi:dihydropteroate synthase